MTATAPIVPIGELLGPSISGPATSAPGPVVTPEMTQKFHDLMQRTGGESTPSAEGKNVVATVLERQSGEIAQLESSLQSFVHAAPGMNLQELAAAHAVVVRDVAMTSAKLGIATSVAQGSKQSLQTLLRNQ